MTTPTQPIAAAILVAMDIEAQPFLDSPLVSASSHLDLRAGTAAQAWRLHVTSQDTHRSVVLLRTGIGLVNSAAGLAAVLRELDPELVISAGTAGGLMRGIAVGDVCVSTTLAYTDADATAFGYVRGQIPGMPATFGSDDAARALLREVGPAALVGATPSSTDAQLHEGQMLAGNSFVTQSNVSDTRLAFPEAVSTDMESTAMAQVCHNRELPFIAVRGVSDLCGPEAGDDFHIGAEEAAARSAAVVLSLLAA